LLQLAVAMEADWAWRQPAVAAADEPAQAKAAHPVLMADLAEAAALAVLADLDFESRSLFARLTAAVSDQ
jgi:hypothetical protein